MNISAKMLSAEAVPVAIRFAILVVSTLVLPVPAPAKTSTGPSRVCIASSCDGFSPFSRFWFISLTPIILEFY